MWFSCKISYFNKQKFMSSKSLNLYILGLLPRLNKRKVKMERNLVQIEFKTVSYNIIIAEVPATVKVPNCPRNQLMPKQWPL